MFLVLLRPVYHVPGFCCPLRIAIEMSDKENTSTVAILLYFLSATVPEMKLHVFLTFSKIDLWIGKQVSLMSLSLRV